MTKITGKESIEAPMITASVACDEGGVVGGGVDVVDVVGISVDVVGVVGGGVVVITDSTVVTDSLPAMQV